MSDNRLSPNEYSPLALAFMGDAVYEVLVRRAIIGRANRAAGDLHSQSVAMVRASAQAEAANAVLPHLTDAELAVYKRGRNAHPAHMPRGSRISDYHAATGLEALFGWLYMSENFDRIDFLFGIILDAMGA
ncbi:MAG: ribonuclease III domain-containing protein [Firmicutes bacterium]|nr:ribonuclease III domain-containing protein [Bacillota bacterium]